MEPVGGVARRRGGGDPSWGRFAAKIGELALENDILDCYLDGYRYRVCRNAGELAEEVSRRESLLESVQVGETRQQ